MRVLLSEWVAMHLHSGRLIQPFPEELGKILNSIGALGCDIRSIYRWNPGSDESWVFRKIMERRVAENGNGTVEM
jgi:hypothetical protein